MEVNNKERKDIFKWLPFYPKNYKLGISGKVQLVP